jgi:hypothetical protein
MLPDHFGVRFPFVIFLGVAHNLETCLFSFVERREIQEKLSIQIARVGLGRIAISRRHFQ